MVGTIGTRPRPVLSESETIRLSYLRTAVRAQPRRGLAQQIIPMIQAIENPALQGLALTTIYRAAEDDPALRSAIFDRAAKLAAQAENPANGHAIRFELDVARYPAETDRGQLRQQVIGRHVFGGAAPSAPPPAFFEAAARAYLAGLADDQPAFRQAMADADAQARLIPVDTLPNHIAISMLARLANAFPALAEDRAALVERALAVAIATNANAPSQAGPPRRSMDWPQPDQVLVAVMTFYPTQEASPTARERLETLAQAAAKTVSREDNTQWRLTRATQLGMAWNALGRHDQARREIEDVLRLAITNPDLSEYEKAWPRLYDVYQQANGEPAALFRIIRDPEMRAINRNGRTARLLQSIATNDLPTALDLIDAVQDPADQIEMLRQIAIR